MGHLPSMDLKAANRGDRLKHALMFEVLSRCNSWPSLTYAETHSGAGIYRATAQDGKDEYIKELRTMVLGVKEAPIRSEPGGHYFSLLKAWWNRDSHQDEYPGSVLQSARFLIDHEKRKECFFRITEADERIYKRLAESVKKYKISPVLSNFQTQIEWLCESDTLVLLVDPWGIVNEVGESCREDCLCRGQVDLETLRQILDYFPSKDRAVALLWTSFGQRNRLHQGPVEEGLKKWTRDNETSYRLFHDNAHHCMYMIGFGGGTEVVTAIPKGEAWKRSWLGNTIREIGT
jgi:hypothetical protein